MQTPELVPHDFPPSRTLSIFELQNFRSHEERVLDTSPLSQRVRVVFFDPDLQTVQLHLYRGKPVGLGVSFDPGRFRE